MVIATLADNVPAVQALGQCIFLPMLIIGGVAVPLASLPDWAQHLSAFFPGRYAVEALQTAVNGNGLAASRFSLLALVTIGAASAIAGTRLFRWDAQQRFVGRGGKGWIAAALVAWVAVGVAAEAKGRIASILPAEPPATSASTTPAPSASPAPTASVEPSAPSSSRSAVPAAAPPTPQQPSTSTRALSPPPEAGPTAPSDHASAPPATRHPPAGERSSPPLPLGMTGAMPGPPPVANAPATSPETPAPAKPAETSSAHEPASWQAVTMQSIDDEIAFDRLPPDNGVFTPIATSDQQPDQDVSADLDALAAALPDWTPGKVADPVQRVRNLLYVPSVVDIFQLPSEPYVPLLVFDQIEQQIPKEDLIKILYWIAVHPDQGDGSAVQALGPLGIPNGPSDLSEVRNRAGYYAVKLLGRITGKRPGK
jgi:hypothetical protein